MAKKLWDVERDLKLVELIKERESIWNKESPTYFCKISRQKMFAEIARALGRSYSASSIRVRWTNIHLQHKDITAKYKNKIICTGEPKWHLWEACSFLNNAPMPKIKIEHVCDDTSLPALDQSINGDIINQNSSSPQCDVLANELLSLLKLLRRKIQTVKYEEFGKEVSECLKRMTPTNSAIAKKEIFDILSSFNQSYEASNSIYPV